MKKKLPSVLVTSALLVLVAEANPFTWVGLGQTNRWADAANWDTAPNWSAGNSALNAYQFIFNGSSVQDLGGIGRRFHTLTFNGGTTVLDNARALITFGSGGGGIVVNGGDHTIDALRFAINVYTATSNGGITVNNGSLTLNAGEGFNISGSSAPRYALFSGNGNITLNGRLLENPQDSMLRLRNDFSGTLTLQTAGSLASGLVEHQGAGELRLAADDALGNMSLSLSGNGARIASEGGSRTLANTVQVSNNFTLSGSNALRFSGRTEFNAATQTVTVANADAELVIDGTVVGASGTLVKDGAGTLVLAADAQSQWAQRIEIREGGLRVGDSGASATGAGEVWIGEDATLWGQGQIDGAVEVLGMLRMGAERLSFGDGLALGQTAVVLVEFGAVPVEVAGDLVLFSGAGVALDASGLWQVGETYTLFEVNDGTVQGALQLLGGYVGQFDYSNGVVSITLTAIPEPRLTVALLGGGVLLLAAVRLRARRRAVRC